MLRTVTFTFCDFLQILRKELVSEISRPDVLLNRDRPVFNLFVPRPFHSDLGPAGYLQN